MNTMELSLDVLNGLSGEESACSAGDTGDMGSIFWKKKWQPTPVFVPEKEKFP